MNLRRVTFSLSKYSGYVYNSFKLKFEEVKLLSSCHSQLWKSNKVNLPRKKTAVVKKETDISHYI